MLADFVDLHDVRMLQAGHGLGFEQKSAAFVLADMSTGQDHLQFTVNWCGPTIPIKNRKLPDKDSNLEPSG